MRVQPARLIAKETKSLVWTQFASLPSEFKIEAGIFEEEGSKAKRRGKKAKKASKLTLAEVAAIHEFGAIIKDEFGNKIGEIPQRSFLRAWFDANKERIQAFFVSRLAAEGPENWRKACNQLALWIEGELRRNVKKRIPPPLAESTILRKGSTVPLIDSSQLVNSLTARVDGKPPT